MIEIGKIISYLDMCREEGMNLQRGMNFRLSGSYSVILMSVRPNAPYADRIEENGKILIYEGHDVPKRNNIENPKLIDQPMYNPSGSYTQNGLFYKAAIAFKDNKLKAENVKVYEKIKSGIWVYNGLFSLIDSWIERDNNRKVFKFKLRLDENEYVLGNKQAEFKLDHNRIIPSSVKLEVWKRDKGKCIQCGNEENLHFDHIIPFSKGGSSLVAENIQLLCAKHNLEKRDKIM